MNSSLPTETKKNLQLISNLAKNAAALLSSSGRSVVACLPRDVKVEADAQLNNFIQAGLKKIGTFPILSEEDSLSSDFNFEKPLWIIDPLDGSLNYSKDIPFFCISIALWANHKPLLGVVYDPNRDELFEGIVGLGAWLNGTALKKKEIISKEEAVLCMGFPTGRDFSETSLKEFVEEIKVYKKIRLFGSAALSLAYVASGRADAYHEDSIALWDVAAGLALVSAAGGAIDYKKTDQPHRWIVKAGIL